MDTVHINLGNDSYDVIIDSGIIGRLGKKPPPCRVTGAQSLSRKKALTNCMARI